jgi:sugar phosphate permease
LSLTTIDLGQLGTVYLVFYMIGQFSSAYFGRKLGPKYLLLTGMGISVICNFFFGISNGFWTVCTFLALNGLAQGTGWPGSIGSLAFWFKRQERGTILGIWSTCYQLGAVMAKSFAAYMLGKAGWQWSFFGASIVLLLIWFIVLIIHPDRPESVGLEPINDEDENNEDAKTGKPDGDTSLGWNRNIVYSILLMGTIYFCIKFLRYSLWSWAPFFLQKNYSMTGSSAGYISSVFDLCGFAGVLFAGFVSDRFFKGRRAMLSFLMLFFMTLAFLFMYFFGSADLIWFVVSMGMIGFMLYGPDSLLSGTGAIDIGSQKGALAAAGIINGMGSAGPIFQEQMIGFMYEKYMHDLVPIFLMLVGIAALGSALTFILYLKSRSGRANI